MKTRMKQLRVYYGLSQAQFAEKIHKSPGHISNIETGRVRVSDNLIDFICTTFSVNKEWLVSGKGSMLIWGTEEMVEEDKIKKSEVGDRIKTVRKRLQLTQSEFGERVGYSKPQIAFVEIGKKTPSNVFLHNVAISCGVSERWLVDGIGTMDDCELDERLIQCLRSNPDVVNELMKRFGLM